MSVLNLVFVLFISALSTNTLVASDKSACKAYDFEKLTPKDLDKRLEEMSGIVIDSQGSFVHIQDSGNDPLLIFTDRQGKVKEALPYAEVATDPEEIQRSSCPWSEKSCFYVFDTGDNFKWRSERTIWAIEEESLRSKDQRIEAVNFTFPNRDRLDSEAAAIVGSTIYIFSKEKKHSRVFTLDKSAWSKGSREAKFLVDLPYTMITGATANATGDMILLISWQGVRELSQSGSGSKDKSGFYPYRRLIKIKGLAQQEAISFDEDQRSFLYSSEKKMLSNDEWGIVRAKCKE